MSLSRRLLIGAPALLPGVLSGVLPWAARAADAASEASASGMAPADPRLGLRSLGNPAAPVHVQEWFSLTCTHCARFDQTVLPDVKTKLIDTGKVFYVFKDFPLDRVALMAAMVARALPPERYYPFIDSLFASQDRWAFAPGVDSKAVLRQMAELAGMSGTTFDTVVADAAYQKAIIAEQDAGQKRYHIDSTPTFVFGQTVHPGEMSYEMFADQVSHVSG